MTARPRRAVPHEVRIIGGMWKRSKLPVLDRPGLRPTGDRIRETLFNWLGQDLGGWRCLDAFAGSGALGFEAASRGAEEVVLVERDPTLVRLLLDSKRRLSADALQVVPADALAYLRRSPEACFDLIFLDPPFGDDLFMPALIEAARVVRPGGFVYLEANCAFDDAAVSPVGMTVHRYSRAGAVHFHLLQKP